jgi:4,5-dihydroxyphthalate decarboxylase
MTTRTSTRTLKTAIGGYGHFEAIKNGSAAPSGVQFEHFDISPITTAFRRMCRGLEFDISEMAITTYLTARRYGLPFTAIPVYPVRAFHHGAAVGNTAAGVNSPKDLEGKKAGVRAYTVTTGVWARGILASEYGLDLDKVHWVLADEEHVEQFHKDLPSNAEYQLGADLAKMTVDGELAGGIGVGRTESENIKPLVPNARQAQAEWNKRTGIYPINHMVVVKDEVLASNPGLAQGLFEAFKESKQQWLAKATDEEKSQAGGGIITGDPYPYGLEVNRPALEAIIGYAYDQHILTERYKPEDIFASGTQNLS